MQTYADIRHDVVDMVRSLLWREYSSLSDADIRQLIPFSVYGALVRFTENVWSSLEPSKKRILNEVVRGRYFLVNVPQLMDIANAVVFDQLYGSRRPVFLLLIPDVIETVTVSENVHHFVHLIFRKRIGLSPYDLLKIIVEDNNNTLDHIWSRVKDRIDIDTFKQLVMYIHIVLNGVFSESIGPGWVLPGTVRVYAICVPRIEEYVKLAKV